MVKSYVKKQVTSDWLAEELDGNHRPSRENVIIAVDQSLVDGQVVSYNSNKEIQAYSGAVSEVAAGIYTGKSVTTDSSNTANGVIVARIAKVVAENLVFKDGLTAGQEAAALDDLAKINITLVRLAYLA
ncbi:hypothetical protein P255_02978 [Acinetobacter brisouii CIP 110357]|uniref:Head decoration protein n=1 Tax=Acinetobacter brisouii CIP 110357 TaxID=1341683 RepID=V2UG53_9GAMM|nr:head decoration protein [Acinetobacter brisouii]ENV46189.1 hypothetical protein F954_02824 [Acinetobacter brisouii ANC 4119]ESK47496.1 hypothetical protein P255_02978 [Acinetobacter brisouii CIP 110357]